MAARNDWRQWKSDALLVRSVINPALPLQSTELSMDKTSDYGALLQREAELRKLIEALPKVDKDAAIVVVPNQKHEKSYDVEIQYHDNYTGDWQIAFMMDREHADALAALLEARRKYE
jgi:hypothetical protein